MARINNLTNFLTDVATAIKTKKGSEASIPATNFDTEILALPSQGVYEQRVLNISANGSQTITPSAGFDAIDELTLTVAVPEKQLQSKTYNFTQNTSIELLPDTGYDGFDSVTLNINVPSTTINNQDKTITENGTYQADQGYTGLGVVTVNVTDPEYAQNLLLSQQILSGTGLPYIPLEYIESTGTQYIETNYTPNNDTKVSIVVEDVKTVDNMLYAVLFSASTVWNYNNFILTYQNYRNINGYRYMLPTEVVFGADLGTNKNKIEIYRGSVWFNSVQISNNNNPQSFANLGTLHICGENRFSDGGKQHNNYKTYSFKIWENSVLLHNFIPVKRKSDNEVCLYDKVTNQFFTNQGTGDFIAGPEIN